MNDTVRKFPPEAQRVETGPIQFGDDWPGIFLRGDTALYFAYLLDNIKHSQTDPVIELILENFAELLSSCDIRKQNNTIEKTISEATKEALNSDVGG